jgi:hypothetical protein
LATGRDEEGLVALIVEVEFPPLLLLAAVVVCNEFPFDRVAFVLAE